MTAGVGHTFEVFAQLPKFSRRAWPRQFVVSYPSANASLCNQTPPVDIQQTMRTFGGRRPAIQFCCIHPNGVQRLAHIIFLHGASSSGKTTIARALQDRIDQPFWHISIDQLRESGILPIRRFDSGEFDWSESRRAFFDGFHGSLAAYADAGNSLILEHILDTEGWLSQLQKALSGHDVLFVAVHCPLQTLIRRERDRGDRPIGSAQSDFETVHVGRTYDLELQSEDGTDSNVDAILAAWRSGRRLSDFARAT